MSGKTFLPESAQSDMPSAEVAGPPGRSRRTLDRSPAAAVYAVLFVQSLMASGTHIVAKVIVQTVDAFTLTLVRSVISAIVMGLILFFRGGPIRIWREDRRMLLLLSLLAIPVNQFLFLFGMRYTTASNAALLYATTPILVLIFSRFFLGERLTTVKIAGVILGFVGVMTVIFERGISASMEYLLGNLLIGVAVMAWGLYTVFGKRLIVRYGAVEASSMTLIIGTVMFIPVGAVPALHFPFATLSLSSWMQILYLAVITSVFSYFLWYFALGRAEAGKVALFANLQPILTTILAVLLLGQQVTLAFVVGGIIALAGVVVAQYG
jgi:drug/metabolite transporter (DMT)-like permease